MSKLDELEAKARAATAGPWVEDDGNVFSAPISNADYEARSRARRDGMPRPARGYDGAVAKCEQGLPNFDADAAFIAAANPATVLALIEVVRAAHSMRFLLPDETFAAKGFDAALAKLEGSDR